jgi:hypothetical protein
MTADALVRDIRLAPRALFDLPDASGAEIRCLSGTVWITVDGDRRDVVLEAGESFSTGQHGRALVYAIGASAIQVREYRRGSAPAAARSALSAIAGAWRRPFPTWRAALRG